MHKSMAHMRHDAFGALVARTPEGHDFLLMQVDYKTGRLSLPGGKLDPEETILNGVNREMREETGLTTVPGEKASSGGSPASTARSPVTFMRSEDYLFTHQEAKRFVHFFGRVVETAEAEQARPLHLGEVAGVAWVLMTPDVLNACAEVAAHFKDERHQRPEGIMEDTRYAIIETLGHEFNPPIPMGPRPGITKFDVCKKIVNL
jgi:8-oxo-dGTP pyrophosphatase MutT (NUDIX family)